MDFKWIVENVGKIIIALIGAAATIGKIYQIFKQTRIDISDLKIKLKEFEDREKEAGKALHERVAQLERDSISKTEYGEAIMKQSLQLERMLSTSLDARKEAIDRMDTRLDNIFDHLLGNTGPSCPLKK